MPQTRTRTLLILMLFAAATVAARGSGSPLADAVKSGNRDAVRALLKSRVDVNAADPDGTTPLQWAAQADDLETAGLLLRAGADARTANRYGSTALSLAAVNGNAPMIEALLKAGADANGVVSRGQTILMTAARTGRPQAVQVLLDGGAAVNAREDLLGETALMWAAAENHAAVVRLLIARGAEIDGRSRPASFPKDRFGLEGVLTILPRGDWTPLMYAARDGGVDSARVLADAGADLNAVDPERTTALVRAIINAHYDTAAVLIERGADPNIADTVGMAALYAAVDMSSQGEIYGRPARKVNDRLTALDIIRMLLEHGAAVNAQLARPTLQRNHTPGEGTLGEGTTPLMRAARNGDYRAMEILFAHGGDAKMVQKNRTTALMLAAGLGRGLGVFAADVGSEADLLRSVELALQHGADVNAVNDTGLTPLHYAAQAGLNTVVTLLARNGAVLDVKDKQGRRPVDVALGVGGRGRAGGPAPVHQATAALIRQIEAERAAAAAPR